MNRLKFHPQQTLPLLAVTTLAALGLAGCGSDGVTTSTVSRSVARSFANLYQVQQSSQGHQVAVSQLRTHATCGRGDVTQPGSGPGQDWVCNITFTSANGAPNLATYQLSVTNQACYSADGDGPASLNGSPTVVNTAGETVVNPLWQFDGCFDRAD